MANIGTPITTTTTTTTTTTNNIIAGVPHDNNTIKGSDTFTPYVKAKMESITFTSDKICREYRQALYNTTMLGEEMKNKIEELRRFVIEAFYINAQYNEIIEPSRRALEFTTEQILQTGRSTAERRAGTSTVGQCKNSIGDKRLTSMRVTNIEPWIEKCKTSKLEDIENWERQHCWLCGLPLKSQKEPRLKIDCEHKLAMMIMMLVGAGLKKTKPRGSDRTKLITDSNTKKNAIFKQFNKQALELHPDWKILVRGEGYAWSHSYCNQYKSQIPFISLKQNGNEYEYVIEVNNIMEFLSGMFEISNDDLEIFFPWYKNKLKKKNKEDWVNQYKTGPGGMKDKWKNHLNLDSTFQYRDMKTKLVQRAFYNIIDMLIPTYFLLNLGVGIKTSIRTKSVQMFQNNTKLKNQNNNEQRSFVRIMNEIPIPARLQDNVGRILGWLTKGDEKKFTEWLNDLDIEGGENPLRKYLQKPLYGKNKHIQEAHSLSLFKGNSLAPIVEEDEDDYDELQDLVKEKSEVPLVDTSTWIRKLKNPGVKRTMIKRRKHKPGVDLDKARHRRQKNAQQIRNKKRQQQSRNKRIENVNNRKDGRIARRKGGKKRTRRRRKKKRKRSKRKKKRKRTKKKKRRRRKITRKKR